MLISPSDKAVTRRLSLLFWILLISGLRAETFGPYTYRALETGGVEIVKYQGTEPMVVVPSVIDSRPVVRISPEAFMNQQQLLDVTIPGSVVSVGRWAFFGCTHLSNLVLGEGVATLEGQAFLWCNSLRRVHLPSSVAGLDGAAFEGCPNLEMFTVDPASPVLTSEAGVLFSKDRSTLVRFPSGLGTAYAIPVGTRTIGSHAFSFSEKLAELVAAAGIQTIGASAFYYCTQLAGFDLPESLVSIGDSAFEYCPLLEEIVLPASVAPVGSNAFSNCIRLARVIVGEGVTSIGPSAFQGCSNLTRAYFLGDAPDALGADAFASAAPGFAIYFLGSRAGFTTPTWRGYPAVRIDEAAWPAAPWLLEHGYLHDTELDQDADGDGVILLLAYALNLDPRRNPAGTLPYPVITEDSLSVIFYAGAAGIEYWVEQSMDLRHWTSDGITISPPNETQFRRASMPRTGPERFLRLRAAATQSMAPNP